MDNIARQGNAIGNSTSGRALSGASSIPLRRPQLKDDVAVKTVDNGMALLPQHVTSSTSEFSLTSSHRRYARRFGDRLDKCFHIYI